MKRSHIVQSNASVSLPRQRLVVAGGTQGVGEGVACRFAKAGAEVWIVGRNETKAKAVLAKLREISQEQRIDPPPEHHFIKADLSLISEAKRVAEAIRARAGPQGIDYLIMTQGGPPNGRWVSTSESHEQHYAVQVLSRFILAHELASDPTASTVKKGVMSIMSPGKTWASVDKDDLDLVKAKEHGKYGILPALCRDSCVIDAFTEDLAERNPNVRFTHVFPGVVKTNTMRNSGVPWYFSAVAAVGVALIGASPESYAEIPLFLVANPEGRELTGKARFWDENLQVLTPHPMTKDENFMSRIRAHLLETIYPKN